MGVMKATQLFTCRNDLGKENKGNKDILTKQHEATEERRRISEMHLRHPVVL